jgi:transposase
MAEKYRVTLTPEERNHLIQMTTTGKAAAAKLRHARILLKADASALGPGCTDEAIATACEVSLPTIARVRKAFVEHGLTAAVERKRPTGRHYRKLDGAQEAQLIAVACSAPPEGQVRWTLRLLADRLVELEVVEAVSAETVRRTLKKTNSSRG